MTGSASTTRSPPDPEAPLSAAGSSLFAGEGEARALMRAVDWSRTSLGPVEAWPASLCTVVRLLLHSRHPMFLWWGPELIQLFNDAYLPSFGVGKLPAAMGQRGADCWQEICPIIGPQIDDVMTRARASWNENQLVPILRNGRLEEVYWTYGYSPVFDEAGSVAGTLVVCTETTAQVLAVRRLRTLNALATHLSSTADLDELIRTVATVLEGAAADVPFAALVRADPAHNAVDLAAAVRLPVEGWQAIARSVGAVPARPGGERLSLPDAPGLSPGAQAFVVPLDASTFVVFGLSDRLPFDDAYREHLTSFAEQVASASVRIEAQRVREATQRARDNLLMQAPIATAVLRGPSHVFELANPLYEQVTGRQNITGKTYREAFPELVDTALPGVLDRVYQTGERYLSGETPIDLDPRGDGRPVRHFFNFNLEPMRDAEGVVLGMMAVAIDLTEQVRARQILEEAQAEREGLLAELQTAARAKDEFLAMLGHELRNPLAPIVTALELMKSEGDTGHAREQQILTRQVQHLVRLVDDLLDVSRIARGKIELRRQTLEIAEVTARAVEIASLLMEERRHHLTVDVPPSGLLWHGDPVRLAQVIANLLTNAARYTEPGGHVRLAAGREGDDFVLSVTDDGIGMAPDMPAKIFEAFFQAARPSDRTEGGLGLGLALVKSLVALHGGTVAARSEGLGKGSEFVVRLPAAPHASPRSSKASLPPTAEALTSRRILVVDDNADAADLLALLLRKAGHLVAVAYKPTDALDEAPRFQPELCILDIGLPIMDGYELGKRLRALLGTSAHIVALTGYGRAHDHQRSEQAGFDGHLVKPITLKNLASWIHAAARGKKGSQADDE